MRLDLANGAPEGVDRLIGQRLRERWRFLGLAQQALAARLGVTFQQVQKYESGANRLSCARLFQIADVLNAPIAELLGLQATNPTPITHSSAWDDFIGLWQSFSAIKSPQSRRSIIDYCLSVENSGDPQLMGSDVLFHLDRFRRQGHE